MFMYYRMYKSKREQDFAKDALGKKLFHEAKKAMAKKKEGGKAHKLYTTLDGELFPADDEDDSEGDDSEQRMGFTYTPATTDPREEPNFLAQMMGSSGVRRRFGQTNASATTGIVDLVSDSATIPTANLVTEDANREAQLRRHLLSIPQQVKESKD